jgi:hypothetical protein
MTSSHSHLRHSLAKWNDVFAVKSYSGVRSCSEPAHERRENSNFRAGSVSQMVRPEEVLGPPGHPLGSPCIIMLLARSAAPEVPAARRKGQRPVGSASPSGVPSVPCHRDDHHLPSGHGGDRQWRQREVMAAFTTHTGVHRLRTRDAGRQPST